jgi:hypothetical protein
MADEAAPAAVEESKAAPAETKAEPETAAAAPEASKAAAPAETKPEAETKVDAAPGTEAEAKDKKDAPPPEGAVALTAAAPAPAEELEPAEELGARDERRLHKASKAVFGKGKKFKKKAKQIKSSNWRDKRPVSVGNWAVPEHLWKVPDLDEWDRDDLQAYFEKFVLTDGTITDEYREKLRGKIQFLAKASTSDFHRPMHDCCVERRVNEAAANLACHRTQKLEEKCIVKRSEDQRFFIPQLNIKEAMKKLAKMGDGKTEREKLQAVEARRKKMNSRGSVEGAEESKEPMSPISDLASPEKLLEPGSPVSPMSEGERSRPESPPVSPMSEADEGRQSNMAKFDDYLK